ncbi:MAG: hypothetical protein R2770_09725 [Acidimicrobiales bacterium]|nr:hypothetical protein [Acidimicrobiales bacterium]
MGRWRVVGVCGVALLASCSGSGEIGVRKTAGGFDVMSRCTDVGIAGFAVGPDVGLREGASPVLESAVLDVQLLGGIGGAEAPFVVAVTEPGDSYLVRGSVADLDMSGPLVVDAEVADRLVFTAPLAVNLEQMDVGDIAVVDYSDEATDGRVVLGEAEFEAGRFRCGASPWPFWLTVSVRVLFGVGALAGVAHAIRAVWRRARQGHLAKGDTSSGCP